MAGTDATHAYEDVGHSEDAREIMEHYFVGNLAGAVAKTTPAYAIQFQPTPSKIEESPAWLKAGRKILRIVAVGSALFLGYEIVSRLPTIGWLHSQHGGFWRGFLISTVASVSLVTGLTLWLESALNVSKDFTSYAPHRKPQTEIAKVTKKVGVLNPREYQKFPLVRKDKLSPNSYRFVFGLPTKQSVLGLPIGQHVSIDRIFHELMFEEGANSTHKGGH